MDFYVASPRRFGDAERQLDVSVTPLTQMVVKSFNKALGTHWKKPSDRKPKIHNRTFKPCDINRYLARCRRMGIEPSIDHDFEEFFDCAGGTSPLSRQNAVLPKRQTFSHPGGCRFESLPTSPRTEGRFSRYWAKVAPYEAPPSSTKYESAVDATVVSGKWIIRSRTHLRNQRNKRKSKPTSATVTTSLDPEVTSGVSRSNKIATAAERDHRDDEPGADGFGYNRLDEVISKRDELYPVPPKLQKMRMRKKVGLHPYSQAPTIGWTDGEKGEEEGEGDGEEEAEEEGGGEIKEEDEELLKDSNPLSKEEEATGDEPATFREEREDGKLEVDNRDLAGEKEEGEDEDEDEADGKFVEFVQGVWDNSDRASIGMKLTRQCFGFSTTSPTQKVISRSFFTVWITIIQMIIFFVIIGLYGIAPIGVDWTDKVNDVLMTDLTIQHQSYKERPNLWIGPREEDLIHLGAKFSPCIRPDNNIQVLLERDRKKEATTGCCINNDGSGCVQTAKAECSLYLSTWNQSTVCGEDPKYCREPLGPWPTDITGWPTCKDPVVPPQATKDYHMTCAVVGRPCCVGVRGECLMSTREYCSFRRGYFHENASLCSQVSCLNEVCGMISFTDPQKPDQFYRFFTSLCIHPGLLALLITMIFQWLVQYDLERYIGWWSMASIYVVCGYCGSILSAIFIPYYVEAGPSGSQFGVLAAMTVEIIRWNAEEKPRAQLAIIAVSLLVLFFIGVIVPQVDNWAHLAGFVIGILLAVGFRPFEHFCSFEVPNYCRIVTRVMCFLWVAALAAILTVVFCLIEVTECSGCEYFNCIPFTETYCMGMGVNISSLST